MAIISISGHVQWRQNLAERVAADLVTLVWEGRDLLEAGKSMASRRELTEAVNQPPPFWQQVRKAGRLSHVLTAALLKRAQGGNLVYHGHAGHFLLSALSSCAGSSDCDMEYRIKAAMEE